MNDITTRSKARPIAVPLIGGASARGSRAAIRAAKSTLISEWPSALAYTTVRVPLAERLARIERTSRESCS